MTFSTWSILNNIIWKILGSSFISNFPLRALGHFDLCWNQHVFEFGKRKERMVQLFKKFCLYLSVLGLCCWVRAFSSCGERASHRSGFSCVERAFGTRALIVMAHGISCSTACGIFLDQGSNVCPLITRWILNHWTTREVPRMFHLSVLFDVNSCTYNKILTVRYQVEFWKILYINIGIAQASTKTYRQHY